MNSLAIRRDYRAAMRSEVTATVRLREVGSTQFDVQLLDLSTSGFRCQTFYGLAVDCRVFITIPTFGPLEACVAWKGSQYYGCRFIRPIHPAVLDTIVARFRDR